MTDSLSPIEIPSSFTDELARYKLAFDISPVPMLLVNDQGAILLANEHACSLFGYAVAELTGMSVESLVPESVRAHHPQLRTAYTRLPTKRRMGEGRDLFGVTRHGELLSLELGIEPVNFGEQVLNLITAINIEQRKLAETRINIAINAAASAMIMCDEKRTITLANNAADTLFGYEKDELLGKKIDVLVPNRFKMEHPVYINNFMEAQSARSMGNDKGIFAVHKNGFSIPVEIALTPVNTPDGKRVMSTIIDLTERVEATRSIQSKVDELAELNNELSQFAFSASHDLKAPLVTIGSLAKMCIEDISDGDVDEAIENLHKVVRICSENAKKIEGVLAIAKVDFEQIELEHFTLQELAAEVWQNLTAGRSDSPEFKQSQFNSCELLAEKHTFNIITHNLLSNALRYSDPAKPDPYVRISSKVVNKSLQLRVEDNGLGISEPAQKCVFQMFKKADSLSENGLGLSLVRKHVTRLGGSIDYETEAGAYTQFVVNLPINERLVVKDD